jgi:hypothetical protein
MSALTVFLAPDGPSGGVLDVLVDLSAAGLVDPFLWVRSSQVESSSVVGATSVGGGVRKPVQISDIVLDQSHDRVRLCVIVPVVTDASAVPYEVEQRVAEMLEYSGSAPVTRVRCLITRPGSVAPDTDVARLGWHNVLIAPEEAHGPDGKRLALPPSTDPAEIGPKAAPVVAGLLGLWSGVEGCPLDGHMQPGLRAVRAFYRRIDADAVEQVLRERVLNAGPELPELRGWSDAVVRLDDPSEAAYAMAERLWHRHRAALIGPREQVRRADVAAMNWRTVLGWLLRFIVAAVRAWPRDWIRGRRNQGAVSSARQLQRAVLGSRESAYKIVVHGFTEDNVPAGWRDIGAASAAIDDRLVAEGISQYQPPAELTEMWRDYRQGAFSLVDAGDRQAMPPRRLSDNRRAVLRFVDDCVPAPVRRFTAIPGPIAARVGIEYVQPGDELGARLLQNRLDHLAATEPMQAMAAGGVSAELKQWWQAHNRSYSVQVGRRIAGALLSTAAEIRGHLDMLDRVATDDAEAPISSRTLTWLFRILMVLSVLGLVTGPTLGFLGVVKTGAAIAIAMVPVALLMIVTIGAFANEQRRIFQELNRRGELMSDAEAATVNLRQAVIDVRRLQDAYEQYLVWSRIVGSVLHRPYGQPVAAQPGLLRIARGLPRTTRVAQALIDDGKISAAAAVLRSDQFDIGWFSRLWDLHLRDAIDRLGLHDLAGRPEEIAQVRGGRVADTPLSAWADLLEREGTSSIAGDQEWKARLRSLDVERRDLSSRLLSAVQSVDEGDRGPVTLADFLAASDQPDTAAQGQEFAPEHFTGEAVTQQRTGVEFQLSQRSSIRLSRVTVLVQLGFVRPPAEFAVTERPPVAPRPPVPAPPEMPTIAASRPDQVGPTAPTELDPDRMPTQPTVRDLVPPGPDGFA